MCAGGGVPKSPVSSAFVSTEGVGEDFNRFRTESRDGDPNRAVCIFSLERIEALKEEGHPIEVGSTGENFTIRGIEWNSLEVGTILDIGGAALELSEPCAPCSKIGRSFLERRIARIDHQQEFGWSRWLARVLREGTVSVGDSVDIIYTEEN
jgi:MOSC domain-containing protein YiiM